MTEPIEIANLVLGIIGTVTGSIAVFIHFRRLKREMPRLDTTVLRCEHALDDFPKQLVVWVTFRVKNLGDRGTSINDIDLTFRDDEYEYRSRMEIQEERQARWISPHQTIEIPLNYRMSYDMEPKEKINCTFVVHHTHGAETIKAISQKKARK